MCTSNRDERKLENTVKQSRFKHLEELQNKQRQTTYLFFSHTKLCWIIIFTGYRLYTENNNQYEFSAFLQIQLNEVSCLSEMF